MANLYDKLGMMLSESLLNSARLMRDLGADSVTLRQSIESLKNVQEILPIEEVTRAAEIRTEISRLNQEIRRLDQTATQSTFSDSIQSSMNTTMAVLKKMMGVTASIVQGAFGRIKNLGGVAIGQIINGTKKSLGVFKQMMGSTASIVKGAFGKLKDLGKLFPTGQIVDAIKNALAKVKSLTGNFGAGIHKLFGRKSKSTSNKVAKSDSKGDLEGKDDDTSKKGSEQGNIIGNALKGMIGATLNYGMADEKQGIKLAALVGTEKADQVSNDLSKYSTQTPYNKQSLMDGAVQLAQGGIGTEAITPMLQNVGDIALGDESKMSQFAEILARTNEEGRLTTGSLETLKGMGFDPLSEIANTTGRDINSLYTDLENGKIGIEDLTDAMGMATGEGGRFHNKAAELGKTLGGQLMIFTNKVNNAMEKLYGLIGPIVTKLVEFAGAALDATINGLGWFIDKIKEGDVPISLLALALGSFISALILYETYMTIASTATAIWGAITAIATSPIFLTILAIVGLIAIIGYLIYTLDGWGEAWDNTLNAVQSLWSGCMNSIKYGWGVVYDALMDGIDGVMIAWYKLKDLWDEDGAAKELEVIQKRSDERKAKLQETRETARQDFINAGESAKKAFNSIHSNGKNLSDMYDEYLPKGLNLGAPNNLPGKGSTKTNINTNPVLNPGTTSNITNSGTSHITINVQDLIGVLNVNREGFRESVNDIEEGLTDALLRVLGTAVTAGSN